MYAEQEHTYKNLALVSMAETSITRMPSRTAGNISQFSSALLSQPQSSFYLLSVGLCQYEC